MLFCNNRRNRYMQLYEIFKIQALITLFVVVVVINDGNHMFASATAAPSLL